MKIRIDVILKATGVFALIIIGVGLIAAGDILEREGTKESGYYALGIGVFILIIFALLSFVQKKNFFK